MMLELSSELNETFDKDPETMIMEGQNVKRKIYDLNYENMKINNEVKDINSRLESLKSGLFYSINFFDKMTVDNLEEKKARLLEDKGSNEIVLKKLEEQLSTLPA